MSHRDMHELLCCLLKMIKSEDKYKDLGNALVNGNVNIEFRNIDIDGQKIIKDMIKKIVTDFLTYNVYKRYNDEVITDFVNEIFLDFKEIVNEEDVLKYVSENVDKFGKIVFDYFNFHDQDYKYQCMAVANVVNLKLASVFTDLYLDYFMTDVEYDKYILPKNVIYGLDLVKYYNTSKKEEDIHKYLNTEFDDPVEKNLFLNYILSNVYADLKINGCNNALDDKIIFLTHKIDKRMKCFYDDKDFVINLVKKYINLYDGVKWYNFVDVRDSISFEDIDLIYKLDASYKHPEDIIKNATYVYTVMGEIQRMLFYQMENFCDMKWDNDQIVDWVSNLVDGNIRLNFESDNVFDDGDKDLYLDLVKLYMASICYEYLNYKVDELNSEEESVYNYLDSDIDTSDCLDLYEDEEDRNVIINSLIENFYCDSKIEVLSRKKMVNDGKFRKVLKFNPFIYLEYRRAFGSLLPLETSKSTEYGNLILGKISDIMSYSNYVNDSHEIRYVDLAQIFKNDSSMLYMKDDEVAGFVVSNIYENLKLKDKLMDNERAFVSMIENDQLDINLLLDNEDYYGRLLFIFYAMNEDYFDDEKFRQLRSFGCKEKIKILKKFDPFYDEDYEILK